MKKLIALILCLAVAALTFAACGGSEGSASEAASAPVSEDAVSSPESAEPVLSQEEEVSEEVSVDEIQAILNDPDIYKGDKYAGMEFRILTFGIKDTPVSEFVYNDNASEEDMPETVNAAIRERNDKVYDALGVTITEEYMKSDARYGGSSLKRVYDMINGAEDEYSMLSICLYDCGTLALNASLWDLNKLNNINMQNPWWEQYFNESVELAGHLYFTTGDIGTSMKGSTPVVFYNTKLISDLGLEDPIHVANRGEWTIDKALEYARAMPHENLPATEKYKGEFGWSGQYDDMYAMLYGSGTRILSAGPDDELVLTLNTETAINTVNKVIKLMTDDSYVCGNDLFSLSNTPMELLVTAFEENRCLFYSGSIYLAARLDMDAVFGILPVPKCTAEQEHYYSMVNTWTSNAYCIAMNLDEEGAEFAAAVMDVMGYYSWSMYPNSLSYNYYEKMLKNQKLAREDSEAMLDLIFEARGCELGSIFQIGKQSGKTNVNEMLIQLLKGKGDLQFVSVYETYKNAFETDTEALNEYFREDAE
ncbi:MAG: hypothetical protein J5760_06840 [Clostridia bacterium]|nr:hypothetical protein [Clostridia bacterium]